MISKKSLGPVLDKSIILTIAAPNDKTKSISVQCAPPPLINSNVSSQPPKFEKVTNFCSKDYVQSNRVVLGKAHPMNMVHAKVKNGSHTCLYFGKI